MSREPSIVVLHWPGTETLNAARAAIQSGTAVEIDLPLEVHYALYKRLKPDPPHSSPEDIDASGGVELLAPITTVAGLEELKGLEAALRRGHYRVRLTSPEPRLRLIPPERATG